MEKRFSNGAVKAVIFDLDGVLLDSEWIGFQVWQEVVAGYGGRLDDSAFTGIVGLSNEHSAEYAMEKAGIRFDIAESCERSWEMTIERMKTEAEALPGAVELVRALAERGCPLAIASNAISRYIDSALVGLGLTDFFPVRVSIDQVARGKPEPDVYLGAAEQLGFDPRACLAVEDSRVGVRAAVAAGMRVIAVPGRHEHDKISGFQEAWKIFPSLTQVNEALPDILR
jgi:HAD superfamily hydrolase (TIGR01509 family)